jgi:hypothetical protein
MNTYDWSLYEDAAIAVHKKPYALNFEKTKVE